MDSGKKFATIQSYVSAIAFAHKIRGLPDPTSTYLAKRFMTGLRKSLGLSIQLNPITLPMLAELIGLSRNLPTTRYIKHLIASVMSLMYHGCLRISEIASSGSADHMLRSDQVQFSFRIPNLKPSSVTITLLSFKHSKAPQKIQILPATDVTFCPVALLWKFNCLKPNSTYFFCDEMGSPITRNFFVSWLRHLINQSTFKGKKLNTHSFRIGRTTDLVMEKGASDAYIRQVGRWSSNAYLKYIRPTLIL